MLNEEKFYELISEVPEPPARMFEIIENKLKEKKRIKKIFFSLAASFFLFLGLSAIISFFSYKEAKIEKEIVTEIEYLNEYLNGKDIEEETEIYTLFDGY